MRKNRRICALQWDDYQGVPFVEPLLVTLAVWVSPHGNVEYTVLAEGTGPKPHVIREHCEENCKILGQLLLLPEDGRP